MEEPPQESPMISPERVQYYQNQAERLLNRHGRDFKEFTKGNEQLVGIGDELIRIYETTGYNILPNRSVMPLSSKKPLIFYSNYTGRTRHFGLLLAEMERNGLITSEQVSLGVKASKVLYGDWEIDEVNEQFVNTQRQDTQGNISYDKVVQTVDTAVIFSPQDGTNALDIARFLRRRASALNKWAIEGSFEIPDVIATRALKSVLSDADFEEVVANILTLDRSQLVVGRRSTEFTRPWRTTAVEMSEELASYLASKGVLS